MFACLNYYQVWGPSINKWFIATFIAVPNVGEFGAYTLLAARQVRPSAIDSQFIFHMAKVNCHASLVMLQI